MASSAPRVRPDSSRRAAAPAEIQLPHATDWRTTDQDEVNRRILRAREESPVIRNLDPQQPIFSNFEVKSRSGITYEVEVRDLETQQFGCTCTDFQINGLGTCKHVGAVRLLLQAKSRKACTAARQSGSPRIDLVPDPERQSLIVERNLTALPRTLRRWFDADGRLPVESAVEFQTALAALGADASPVRLSVTVAPWLESLRLAEEKRQLRREYEQRCTPANIPPTKRSCPSIPTSARACCAAFTGRAMLADRDGPRQNHPGHRRLRPAPPAWTGAACPRGDACFAQD